MGTYANIAISVSDAVTSVTLPPFSIQVTSPPTFTANLTWTLPTLRDDGSQLNNLAGFKIYVGQSSGNYTQVIDVPGATVTSHNITGLTSGIWYFAIAAYDQANSEGNRTLEITRAF